MSSGKAKKEIERLRRELNYHDYQYYVLNAPVISDYEYDRLYRRLRDLEAQFPQYVTADSPTQRVGGAPQKEFKTVTHAVRMLSLDNTYNQKEVEEFDERVRKRLGVKIQYEVTLKVDGVAVTLRYQRGILRLGATRGDGIQGDDITQNIKTIRSVPLKLFSGDKELQNIEVRGEVYLAKRAFEKLNEEREKRGEATFANPRNAAAGTLKLLDPREVARRKLDVYIHTIPRQPGKNHPRHSETLFSLEKAGFKIIPHLKVCSTLREVFDYIDEWQAKREELDYGVDGLVIKVDRFENREILGNTIKSPRWAIAYKYPARQATTRLLEIQVQVGRTGRITPVAVLEPVSLSGSTIARATLHNEDEIRRKDIRVGDRVIIEKGGEVIPKVIAVLPEKRSGAERKFRFPRKCPVCNEKILRLKGEADWRCVNASCPAQLKAALMHFASRQAMDIEGFGCVLIDRVVDQGLVRSFDEIYQLTTEILAGLERMGQKSAQNLVHAIGESKKREFTRVLYALGIPNVGIHTSHLLIDEFNDLDSIVNARTEDITEIHGIGDVVAESIVNYFKNRKNIDLIENLKRIGLNFQSTPEAAGTKSLAGMTFVFTGELKNLTREEAQALVRQQGGHPSSSVSKSTDYVVAGARPGSKHSKARSLGVKIITERDFLRLIKKGIDK